MSDLSISLAGNLGIAYPERHLERESRYEAWVRDRHRLLFRPFRPLSRGLDAFPEKVEAAALDLTDISDSKLKDLAHVIGQRLRREGLTRPLVARSFALVREASSRCIGMRHYDVQLMGGWVLLSGMVAEMEAGEGKTLTATLAAVTAALAGIPVHVVTSNDYLATRDAEWMGPVYQALGLKVGAIYHGLDTESRREAYRADITYCSSKEITFDFLKDRIALGDRSRRLQVKLEQLYTPDGPVGKLLLRGLGFAIVDEADDVLIDEARTPLIISSKSVSEDAHLYQEALALAAVLSPDRHFRLRARERQVALTDEGRMVLVSEGEKLGGIWQGPHRREELVTQALAALHLYNRDVHYLIEDEKVQIVDEYTGRVLADRSWEQGLHQMIEVKEGVPVTGQQKSLARTSYQNFFRRYLRLAGMTGTAREIAQELWSVYRLEVVSVPTNQPLQRHLLPTQIYPTTQRKWEAVVARIVDLHEVGRPVLIGTRSVLASEDLSSRLRRAGLEHQVLNARQDREEAEIVARAGDFGTVTVATNMAGRGTDIKLGQGVAEIGGLHVIATEMHDAGRIDRQLFGRCGRQGDPGSYEMLISQEDELVRHYGGKLSLMLADWMSRIVFLRWATPLMLHRIQRRAERYHFRVRQELLSLDERLAESLAFTGRHET